MFSRKGEKGDIEQILHAFQLVDEVILCSLLDRAYVIVPDYGVALAERLAANASAQTGWTIKVMTRDQLDTGIGRAVATLRQLDGVEETLAERLMGEGILTFVDLAGVDAAKMAEVVEIPVHQAAKLVRQAKEKAFGA